MAYAQKPFSSYKWIGTGAELGGVSYAPQPYRYPASNFQYTFKPFATGDKGYRVLQIDGDKYLVTFSHWEYDSQSEFSGWQSRITTRTETVSGVAVVVLDVNGSLTNNTYPEWYGGAPLYVSAHYVITPLQSGDPHYDESADSASANPGSYEEDDRFAWVLVLDEPGSVLDGSPSNVGGACPYHEIITSYEGGGDVHYGYIGYRHNLSPRGRGHKYTVDETVMIGLHGSNLERPYAESSQERKTWRFDRWEPSPPATWATGYTYNDGSVGFVLTESIIQSYARPKSEVAEADMLLPGASANDPVIVFTAHLSPILFTFRLAVHPGHATIKPVSAWYDAAGRLTTQYVTVVENSQSCYDARVPYGYSAGYNVEGIDLLPVPDAGWEIYRFDVTKGSVTESYGKDDLARIIWLTDEYSLTGASLIVDFFVRRANTGRLLCTGSGAMLCNSSGQLMYAG